MKKKIIVALMLVTTVFCLMTGCGETASTVLTVPAADVSKAIVDQITINSAVEKDISSYSDYYTLNSTDDLEDVSVYICASGAYPDEIAVFRFKTAEAANANLDVLNNRLASQKELFSTYTPDEMYKLDGAKVYVTNNYAILLACSDNDKAKEIADGMLK